MDQVFRREKIGLKKDFAKSKKPKQTKKKKVLKKVQSSSSSNSDMDINIPETSDDEDDYVEDWNENECVGCGEYYNETKQKVDWIQCVSCLRWLHEGCSRFEVTCDYCGKKLNSKK